jgi:hypothetical protein
MGAVSLKIMEEVGRTTGAGHPDSKRRLRARSLGEVFRVSNAGYNRRNTNGASAVTTDEKRSVFEIETMAGSNLSK